MKIKNEVGEEVEVYTAAELEERSKTAATDAATKAVEEFKKQSNTQVETLQTQLADAEARLQAAEDKDEEDGGNTGQVMRLRKERDEANKKLTEWQTTMEKKLQDAVEGTQKNTKTEILDAYARGDAKLREKLEFFNDKFKDNPTDAKGWKERMDEVYLLATKKPAPNILDGITSGGSRGVYDNPVTQPGSKQPPTQNAKNLGKLFGLTDADWEKYHGKTRSSTAD